MVVWGEHAARAPERLESDPLRGLDGGPPEVRWWAWFVAGRRAVWELYRRHGWEPVAVGPLPGHRLSGCEQTVLVAVLLSRRDPAAIDGASTGTAAGIAEVAESRWRSLVAGDERGWWWVVRRPFRSSRRDPRHVARGQGDVTR